MTDTVGTAIIEVAVGTGGVDAGLQRMDERVQRSGRTIATLGTQGTAALDAIGTGSTAAASRVDNATRSLAGSIERATAALEAGKKSGSEYFEVLARNRGADMDVLGPLIAQLRAVEAAQASAAETANELRIAQEAAAEAARAESVAQREATQALAGRENFLNGLREQIALYGRSSEEVMKYRAAQAGVELDAAPLIAELQRLRDGHEEVAAAARAQAQAEREAAQAQSNRNDFISNLEQQTAAIGRTRSELLELRAAQLGVSDQAAPFIARLREAESGLNHTGISAAQTAAALRGVPAQFTDIVTSIQGGQAPLTVFLQQGGQLRDMFGGAAPAARALGGYIMGLVNPFTLAAAGAAALAVAYNQGSKEADAFARSIILTGNAAGTTTDQLTDMARAISKNVGTQGDAAAALAALAGTGKVGADNLQRFATVAVKAQRDIGIAASETAKDFAELGKAPLQASEKLNEKYGYLTGAVYAQIKALQDQGRAEDAATVAQNAYADAMESRSGKLRDRLGVIEKAWLNLKEVAKGSWDAMLDVGREDTLEQKLARVQAQLQKSQGQTQGRQKSMFGGDVGFDPSAADAGLTRQQQGYAVLERLLQGQIKLTNDEAAAEGEVNKKREARLEWEKLIGANISRQTQLQNELTAVRVKGNAAEATEEEIIKAQAETRKKYADIYNDAIDAQIEKIKQRAALEQEADKRANIAAAMVRSTGLASSLDLDIAQAQKTEAREQAAIAREKAALQDELELTKKKLNSQKAQSDLRAKIDLQDEKSLTRKRELEKQIFDLDVADSRRAANALADLADNRRAELQSLQDQLRVQQDSNSLIGASRQQVNEFNLALANETATRLETKAAIIGTDEARQDEAETMRKSAEAMRSLAKAQADGAIKTEQFEQQKRLWESIDQTAHDTFVNIFNDGKNAFDRLRDTLKSGLLDLLYQMTVKKWIFNIGAEASGYSAIGALGGNAASAAGGSSQAISLLQVGKGIYDAIGTGFAGVASTIGGGITALGGFAGSSGISAFGAGMGLSSAQAAQAAAAYNGAGMASTGSAISAGATTGAAVTAAAGIAAGVLGGHLISGQYGSNSTVNAGTAVGAVVGSIVPVIGPAIGALVGGLLGGLANRAFGMGNKEITSQGITGTLTADSFTGENFTNWHQDGGWFRGDKNGTDKTPVDASVAKTFVDTYAQLKTVTSDFAKALGADVESLSTRSQSLNIALTQDAEANKTAIANFFSGVADSMAKELVPSLVDFTAEGETASATLQRLAGDYKAVDSVLMTIGRTSEEAFSAVGVASIAARERLIAAAGGLDALASGTAYFAQNFLSPAEQMAPIIANVKKQLADLGAAAVTNNEQFKELVLGIDLSTEAGAKQYAALLQLAPQFKQVTDYMGSLSAALDVTPEMLSKRADLQRQIDDFVKSTLTATELRALETKGMDETTLALYDRLAGLKAEAAAQQAATAAQEAATAAIKKAQEAAANSMQSLGDSLVATMKNAEAAGKSITSFATSLMLGDLSPLDPEKRYQAAKKQLLASDPGDTEASTAFLNAAKDRDAGDFSYSRDFELVQARLASAAAKKFALAASIPDTWQRILQMYRDQMAAASASPGQALVAASTPTPASNDSVGVAVAKMADKVVAALAPIAENTSATAFVLDQVTEGGSGMVVAQ